MRQNRLLLLAMALMTVSVTGLWGNGTSETPETTTLTVWDFKYGEVNGMQPPMQAIDALFTEANPGIELNHVAQPGELQQYYQLIRAAATSQSGPDVIMYHGGSRAWDFNEIQVPLDDYIASWRSEISEFSWTASSYLGDADNPVKLVPLTVQGQGFYYDKAMFAEAGLDPETPPKTPEAFLAASEALKNVGISPIVTGMSPNVMWDWLARVLVANAYPGGSAQQWSTGEANFDDAPFVRAVEFIDTLRENEYFHPDSYDIPVFMDALELFKSGEGAIFIGLLSDIAHWKDFADARGEGNIGYFPTINFSSDSVEDRQVLNGAGLGYSITTWSDAKDAAAAYLEFYGREGAPILLESVGALHPNQSVDASSLGYPILGDVLSYLSNGTASIDSYVPNAAWDLAIRQLSQSWLIGELTAQEYIEQSQRILEAERDNL